MYMAAPRSIPPKKVNELRDERARDKRAGKGKVESAYASDAEKLEEVQLQLAIAYTEMHTKLMKDLHQLHVEDRAKHIGPMMVAFLQQEKRVAATYTAALDKVHTETSTDE